MGIRTILSVIAAGAVSGAPACGDCISIGYPSVDLTVLDAATGAPVGLGGSVLIVTSTLRRDSIDTGFMGVENRYSICCVSGPVRIQIQQASYAAWDSTVVVRTSGHCDIPKEIRVRARLRRG